MTRFSNLLKNPSRLFTISGMTNNQQPTTHNKLRKRRGLHKISSNKNSKASLRCPKKKRWFRRDQPTTYNLLPTTNEAEGLIRIEKQHSSFASFISFLASGASIAFQSNKLNYGDTFA